MYNNILILSAIRHLQPRRPDASVLFGDLQEVLSERGVTWGRSTVQLYLKRLVNQRVLEQVDRNVYRLLPTDNT